MAIGKGKIKKKKKKDDMENKAADKKTYT